jgi:hypothetical protein
MRSWASGVIVVAGVLAVCGHAPAQELPPEVTAIPAPQQPAQPSSALARLDFANPTRWRNRRGSPVDTLEGLTGAAPESDQVAEAGTDEIETDRDSFTPATSTVGRRRLVTEVAYSFIDNRRLKETHSVPELILRYGLTERVELRLGWNYEVGGAGNEVSGADAADEDPTGQSRLLREYTLAYGAKIRLTDQRRWLPRSAVIVQGFTPTGGETNATQMIATYVAGWQLPSRLQFDAAIRYGIASEAGDHFNHWAPSAVVKIPFRERWAAHIEYFGIITSGKAENTTKHFVSPGLHYLVTSDFEVGFRLGWGLNDQSARFFGNVGLGWRF